MPLTSTSLAACGVPEGRQRHCNFGLFLLYPLAILLVTGAGSAAAAPPSQVEIDRTVESGLEWLARQQSARGNWTAQGDRYPTAMTALAGMAMLCEGSTATQGKYAPNIRKAVDYLLANARPNGLIGDPFKDDRYTYGHGFSMLFLSQILGEEEDADRREQIIDVLTQAVVFTGRAQTPAGGWGYVSSQDGGGFDEGSTTITQVQGLRACRNAGIPVPKEIVDKAVEYIKNCTTPEGGVQYSSKGGGPRPAITAAAVACLFNAGEYDSEYVPKLLEYCEKNLGDLRGSATGHWHYAHYYYSQVLYREGGDVWRDYYGQIAGRLISEAQQDGSWSQGYIGPVYTTAINLTILQLNKGYLPIYQR